MNPWAAVTLLKDELHMSSASRRAENETEELVESRKAPQETTGHNQGNLTSSLQVLLNVYITVRVENMVTVTSVL